MYRRLPRLAAGIWLAVAVVTVHDEVDHPVGLSGGVLRATSVAGGVADDGRLDQQRAVLRQHVGVVEVEEVDLRPVLAPRDDGRRVAEVHAPQHHLLPDQHHPLVLAPSRDLGGYWAAERGRVGGTGSCWGHGVQHEAGRLR